MGINKVQFQKGLSMAEFMERYGTEEKCHAALVALRCPNGFVCPECGGTRHCTFEPLAKVRASNCFADPLVRWGRFSASVISFWPRGYPYDIFYMIQRKASPALLNALLSKRGEGSSSMSQSHQLVSGQC